MITEAKAVSNISLMILLKKITERYLNLSAIVRLI
jgi:hypothetical protein